MTTLDSGTWCHTTDRRYTRNGCGDPERPYEPLRALYIRPIGEDDFANELIVFKYDVDGVPVDAARADDPHDFAAMDRIMRHHAKEANANMLLVCDPFHNSRELLERLGYTWHETDENGDEWYTARCEKRKTEEPT